METTSAANTQTNNWLIIISLSVALFLGLTWANYHYLTGPARYANRDFMSLWAGGRALLEGLNPYEPDIWNPLRARLGSTWMPDDRAPFPLWTLMLYLPFSLLDMGWAAAAWLALSLFLLGFCLFLLMSHFSPEQLPVTSFVLLALGAFTFRGGLVTLNNGQISFVLLFVLILFIALSKRNNSFLAGFVLAFVALKPNPFILFVPLLGLWLIQHRRWRIVSGALAGGLTLLASSWLLRPGWLIEWLDVRGKTEVASITPTLWGLAYELSAEWWAAIGVALVVATTAVLGCLVFTDRTLAEAEVVSMAIAGSLLVTPYAWDYEHLLLLVPIILIFLRTEDRRLATLLWILLAFVVPWGMFWIATSRNISTLSFVVPLSTIVVFWLLLHRQRREGQSRGQAQA